MAWLRKTELIVEDEDGLETTIASDEANEVGLHISFDIQRDIDFTKSTANFKVYNAAKETREKILKDNNKLTFKAGYSDETEAYGVIFIGFIYAAHSYHRGEDWVTEVEVMDQLDVGNIESKYYKSGTEISKIINEAAGLLGYTIENESLLSGITVTGGFSHTGYVRGYLQKCADILSNKGLYLFVDCDKLIILDIEDEQMLKDTKKIVYLDYESGLLNIEDITKNKFFKLQKPHKKAIDTKKKVGCSTILIPNLSPGGVVNFDGTDFDGSYVIESVNFYGDNFGGDFNCKLETTL